LRYWDVCDGRVRRRSLRIVIVVPGGVGWSALNEPGELHQVGVHAIVGVGPGRLRSIKGNQFTLHPAAVGQIDWVVQHYSTVLDSASVCHRVNPLVLAAILYKMDVQMD